MAYGNGGIFGTELMMCDFYICDGTGDKNNNFLGDCKVECLFPVTDGQHTEFTPSTGTTHYTLLNEAVPDSATLVSSNVVGQRDTYYYQSLENATVQILGVQACNNSSKSEAGYRTINFDLARVNSNNHISTYQLSVLV